MRTSTRHCDAPAAAAPTKSTAQLLNTYWKLTQLGEQVITTPAGAREIHFVLHSENQRVAGFSGCNRMMGSYVLKGDKLRFDQMAGTMMACVDRDWSWRRNFSRCSRRSRAGKSAARRCSCCDADGKPLANFESRYLK